jgi:DinB superfamily
MMTGEERQSALDSLARSRQVLLDAVAGVTDAQAKWKPAPDRWSILEYVEHLAISDDALIALIERSLKDPPRPETEEERRAREQKIRATAMPRGVNHAPDALKPVARFSSLSDAIAAFLAARDRTTEYARTVQHDLRSHFANHSVLGPLDGYQWLVANARHVENHAAHIREIRALQAPNPAEVDV